MPAQALLVLEAAQHSRTRSAPIRLAAMSLHGMLGAATSAIDSFDALDIKHIQHDTLSGKRPCKGPKSMWLLSIPLLTRHSGKLSRSCIPCMIL